MKEPKDNKRVRGGDEFEKVTRRKMEEKREKGRLRRKREKKRRR